MTQLGEKNNGKIADAFNNSAFLASFFHENSISDVGFSKYRVTLNSKVDIDDNFLQYQHQMLNFQKKIEMLERSRFLKKIDKTYEVHSVCAILGPRQCGKTTLAQNFIKNISGQTHYFDLEDPTDLAKLDNPKLTLEPLDGFIIIDEIQRREELFPYLRVLVDKFPHRKYLILGSSSRDLIRQSSESLAGRIGYVELTPFMFEETGNLPILWNRGGFPKSYLAQSDAASTEWRTSYITSFLERDLAALGFNISPQEMRRLWSMLAHYHGNILNYSELGRSLGVSDMTIRRHVQVLEGSFMVRCLKPWFANMKKRQVKAPKVYLRDSGILHTFHGIETQQELILHPKVGASWEGFALEEIIRWHRVDPEGCYFWRTHDQAELDLLLIIKGKKLGFEFKYTDSPKMTRSMRFSQENLQLDQLTLIVPGNVDFPLTEFVKAKGLENYLKSGLRAVQ